MKQKAEQHQSKHAPVAFDQLREKLRTESGEYLSQHIHRVLKIGITEEYPAETDKVESDNDSEYTTPAMTLFSFLTTYDGHPHLMHRQSDAVKCSPKYKVPGSSVPQSTQKHGNNQIQILAELTFPVSSQGYVQVIAQPTGQ